MNLRILLFAAAWACLPWSDRLQAEETPGYTATVSDERVKLVDRQVVVTFTLDLGEPLIGKQHKRTLTPVIATSDGRYSLCLPSVIVSGRNRSIKDRTLGIAEQDAAQAYRVLKGNRPENRRVAYETRVDYRAWMDSARLTLLEEVTGCACGGVQQSEQVLQEALLYVPQVTLAPLLACPKDYTPRQEERDAYLIYPVNQTTLWPDRYGNRAELQKIDSALAYVQRNPAYRIRRMDISGFASPEGSWQHNVALAEGRAEALKQYITRQYDLPDTLWVVTPGAENWEGLREALQTYELPYKEDILRVMDEVEEPDEREAAIRRIGGGVPYRTLREAIYPLLRKNSFRIAYISRERTPEEARELVFTAPGELNVYEFYTVADTFYADDRDGYARVLLQAADTYPQHAVANANAARLCIEAGRWDEAERYLTRAAELPSTWSNRAFMLWQQGRKDEAQLWWRKAAEAGDTTARHNLEEIAKRETNERNINN